MPATIHGGRIHATTTDLVYTPDLLAECLGDTSRTSPRDALTGVQFVAPTDFLPGRLELQGVGWSVELAPGTAEQSAALVDALEQLRADASAIPDLLDASAGAEPALPEGAVAGVSPRPGLSFVALDVETANADNGSICQLGLARVTDGKVAETASWLCRPPEGLRVFEEGNIAIHGITEADVADAPDFAEVWPLAQEFIGSDLVIAHSAQFDIPAVQRATAAAGIATVPLASACTLALSRATDVGQRRNGLAAMCEALDIDLTNHHDAEADAVAAAEIFCRLAARDGHAGSAIDYFHRRGFSAGGLANGVTVPVLRDIAGDRVPAQREQMGLEPLGEQAAPAAAPAPKKPAAKSSRRAAWAKARTPEVIPDPNPTPPENSPFAQQVIVLTGDFGEGGKESMIRRLALMGGQVAKNVTKKTTMLICGPWEGVTTKQKKAEDLIDKGQDLSIISAEEAEAMLGEFADELDSFAPVDLTPPF